LANGPEAKAAGQAVVEEIEMVVFKLDDLSTIDTNEVVVVGVIDEIGIISGLSIAEFDLVDEVGFNEEGEGAVNGGAGGLGASGAKPVEEFVGSKVFVSREDDLEDFIPL